MGRSRRWLECIQPAGGQLSVSAGSRDTARYTADEMTVAQDHAQRLLNPGRTVLVQPYQDSDDIRGETALVFVDGRFSHAANKAALLAVGQPPTADNLFATEMAATVLELVEPSMFFSCAPAQAVSRFAAAITAAAKTQRRSSWALSAR